MFQGKTNHQKTVDALNSLNWEFYECAEVRFAWEGMNRHSFNRLFAVIKSDGGSEIIHTATQKKFKLKTMAIYFLSSNEEYKFKFDSNTSFLSFHFNCFVNGCREIFSHSSIFIELTEQKELINELAALINCKSSAKNTYLLHQKLISLIIRIMPENDDAKHHLYERDIKIHTFLLEHADGRTTVNDLALQAGVSADTLSRRFSHDYGETLKKIISRAIIGRAERFLRDDSLKIKDVAALLNFNDEYYFSRFFKRETGKSPVEFRRMTGIIPKNKNTAEST